MSVDLAPQIVHLLDARLAHEFHRSLHSGFRMEAPEYHPAPTFSELLANLVMILLHRPLLDKTAPFNLNRTALARISIEASPIFTRPVSIPPRRTPTPRQPRKGRLFAGRVIVWRGIVRINPYVHLVVLDETTDGDWWQTC
jgi:hypothetical protein